MLDSPPEFGGLIIWVCRLIHRLIRFMFPIPKHSRINPRAACSQNLWNPVSIGSSFMRLTVPMPRRWSWHVFDCLNWSGFECGFVYWGLPNAAMINDWMPDCLKRMFELRKTYIVLSLNVQNLVEIMLCRGKVRSYPQFIYFLWKTMWKTCGKVIVNCG